MISIIIDWFLSINYADFFVLLSDFMFFFVEIEKKCTFAPSVIFLFM